MPQTANKMPYSVIPKKCKCHCRAPLITDTRDYYNKVYTGSVSNCLMNCRSPYFSEFDKNFPTFWLGLWACLCIVSTVITMATFFVDRSRFQYPERPIIFLSFCYLLMAIGYVVRVGLGHEAIACKGDSIRYGLNGTVPCSIVFLLIYFFGMASSIWWVILTATWFLAAGLKWSSEAITMYSDVYHFFAWFIPGFQSIFVLTMTSVDGDPIAGICFVGNTNKFNLLIFVILPLLIYLVIGSAFLLAGYFALMKIRRTIREKGESKTDKLENLMLRIGIFGIVYSVPSATVIFCCVYELLYRDKWERTHTCPCEQKKYHPEYAVFMLKYFMTLIVGTTSGFWVWTSKTLDTWHKVLCRSCCNRTYNHGNAKFNKIDIPKSKPETLSTKTLLDCMNSSYNMNGHPIRSSSSMIRSGIALTNTTDSEIVSKLIPLTHV